MYDPNQAISPNNMPPIQDAQPELPPPPPVGKNLANPWRISLAPTGAPPTLSRRAARTFRREAPLC